MPIISNELIQKWVQRSLPTREIPIPDMDVVEIIEEVLKFSNELDNLQIRLVPRKCTRVDVNLSPY